MALGKITHLDFLAYELEETVKYLTEKLGVKRIRRTTHGGEAVELISPDGDEIFEFHPPTKDIIKATNEPRGSLFLRHIAFEVEDLDKTYEELKSKGMEFSNAPLFTPKTNRKLAMAYDAHGRRFIQLEEKKK